MAYSIFVRLCFKNYCLDPLIWSVFFFSSKAHDLPEFDTLIQFVLPIPVYCIWQGKRFQLYHKVDTEIDDLHKGRGFLNAIIIIIPSTTPFSSKIYTCSIYCYQYRQPGAFYRGSISVSTFITAFDRHPWRYTTYNMGLLPHEGERRWWWRRMVWFTFACETKLAPLEWTTDSWKSGVSAMFFYLRLSFLRECAQSGLAWLVIPNFYVRGCCCYPFLPVVYIHLSYMGSVRRYHTIYVSLYKCTKPSSRRVSNGVKIRYCVRKAVTTCWDCKKLQWWSFVFRYGIDLRLIHK